jgi:hypothetical protein
VVCDIPVGLRPAACPNGGTWLGSTSLLTGMAETEATKKAVTMANFMLVLSWNQSNRRECGAFGGNKE